MKTQIIKLDINDFEKCGNIWDMQRQSDLAKQFYREMRDGNRTTYVYTIDGTFIGEDRYGKFVKLLNILR